MPTLAFATYRLWMGVLVYAVVFAFTGRRVSVAVLARVRAGRGVLRVRHRVHLQRLPADQHRERHDHRRAGARVHHPRERLDGSANAWSGATCCSWGFVRGRGLVALGSAGSPTWSPLGDAFAAASVLSWTCYWLFSKRARARTEVGALEYMACVMTVAAVIMTFLALAFGQSLSWPSRADWGWIWLVTIFPGFIGHSLISWSHRHLEAWLGSLITQLQPVIATAAGWILLSEAPTELTIAGGLVVVAATAAIMIRAGRQSVSIGEGAVGLRIEGLDRQARRLARRRTRRSRRWPGPDRDRAARPRPTMNCSPDDRSR